MIGTINDAVTTGPRLADDPAVPQRDAMLDPFVVRHRLASLLSLDSTQRLAISEIVLARVKYRIGESLRVVYRLTVGGRVVTVAARTFPDTSQALAALQKALRNPQPTNPLRPAAFDDIHRCVWWVLPNDRKISGLGPILNAEAPLGALFGFEGEWAASTLVEYAPERSATIKATDAGGRALGWIKVSPPGSGRLSMLARHYRRVGAAFDASGLSISTPKVLRHHDHLGLISLSHQHGTPWGSLTLLHRPDCFRNLGQALGVTHTLPVHSTDEPFGRLRWNRIVQSGRIIAVARPDLATSVERAVATLAATRPHDLGEFVVLHGDVHPKNALMAHGRLALIDFDQYGIGPAAADIGSLFARLYTGVITGEFGKSEAAVLAGAFTSGYASVRPLPNRASVRWHTGVTLLAERAIRAVNRCHPALLAALDEILLGAVRAPTKDLW